jgi:TPR repeat protein
MVTAIAAPEDVDARGDPYLAEFERARDLLQGSEWRRGLKDLEDLAHRGSIMSMLLVSGCMLEGWGYDQDLPGAEAWYRVAAQSGSARGYFGLGLARLRMGRFREAIDALEAAISNGYPPAYNALAYIYSQGEGVPIDRRRALGLWRTGSSLGHLASKRGLTWALVHGYAGIRGRFEGFLHVFPLAVRIVRAKREPIPIGSGGFHRV